MAEKGRVVGWLASGEDREALEDLLSCAPERVNSGELELVTHNHPDAAPREERLASMRAALQEGRLKRYAFSMPTSVGPRIVKVAETIGARYLLRGLHTSVSRNEHRLHARARELGLAASESRGYLELRRGLRLVRSIQVQTPVPQTMPPFDDLYAQQSTEDAHGAAKAFGKALAETHGVPFFHADLKGYHAFGRMGDGDSYRLAWIDFGRVSFYVTPRKRIINLYQALRFVLPDDESLQRTFIEAYCEHSGWHQRNPERAETAVRRFLAHKLRTLPRPFG